MKVAWLSFGLHWIRWTSVKNCSAQAGEVRVSYRDLPPALRKEIRKYLRALPKE